MTLALLFLLFWLACGFVASGWTHSYARNQRLPREHGWIALGCGPAALIVHVIAEDYRHGWRKWW